MINLYLHFYFCFFLFYFCFMKKILRLAKNKYLIASAIFVVYVGFLDQNSVVHQLRLSAELRKARQEKEFYLTEIEKDTKEFLSIHTNAEEKERYAREKYLMKKDNEDIFLIVTDAEKKEKQEN